MSELNMRRADGSHIDDPDSGFALLGFGATPAPPTADTRVADPMGPPLTRRELRAREQAELAKLAQVVQEAPAVPQAPVAPLAPQVQQAPAAPAAAAMPQASVPLTSVAARSDVSGNPSPKLKAPRKPKLQGRVKPPRGISRPRASARPPRNASASPVRRKPLKRRLLSKLMTFGAMVGAGLMMVSTSLPANAFYPVETTTGTTVAAAASAETQADVQSMKVVSVGNQTFTRDNYTAVSLRERLFLKFGNRNWAYTNDPNGTIQWPFAISVPISSGFGERIAPCGGCSSYHEGVDFTPGGGFPIQAIADGVVSLVANDAWGLGSHVVIDHHINGQLVQSVYGHMRLGSIKVTVGQAVKVTDIVGLVGSTGISTGDHLHLEIHVNGVQVDPFAWLKANAN